MFHTQKLILAFPLGKKNGTGQKQLKRRMMVMGVRLLPLSSQAPGLQDDRIVQLHSEQSHGI